MMIEVVGGVEYEVSQCGRCAGTGERYDPTAADKVNAGPYAGRCATCSGKGKIYRNRAIAEAARAESAQLAARRTEQEIGDMPDWMC